MRHNFRLRVRARSQDLPQHEMMQAQLQHFRPILQRFRDGIQFGHGFAIHPKFGVAAGAAQLPFERHRLLK